MHVHWHRRVEAYAQWDLRECRCGSRRTLRRPARGYSPLMHGWPRPDAQAHPMPEGGWPTGPPPMPPPPTGPAPGAKKTSGPTRH